VPGLKNHCSSSADGFVSGPTDLEVDLVLTLELDFPVVQPPRHLHHPEDADQRIAVQPAILCRIESG
jgi:hypothetical protein